VFGDELDGEAVPAEEQARVLGREFFTLALAASRSTWRISPPYAGGSSLIRSTLHLGVRVLERGV